MLQQKKNGGDAALCFQTKQIKKWTLIKLYFINIAYFYADFVFNQSINKQINGWHASISFPF